MWKGLLRTPAPRCHWGVFMSIGGVLGTTALAALSGTHATDEARMRHFHTLTRSAQGEAIRRLAAMGQGEHTIAHATGLSVKQIRRVLAEVSA